MARNNQKLINFHTSGNAEVPLESLFYGEIAVRHCSGDSAAELIIKNSENTSAVFVETAKMCIDCGTWDGGDSHEYVDLGLPSGTLWATENIKNGNGDELFFAWGGTSGYTSGQVGTVRDFSWNDYEFGTSGNLTKYTSSDHKTVLDAEDDAATANWGNGWCMPTKEQLEELYNDTYVTKSWDSERHGLVITSNANGNSLFVFAAGGASDGDVSGVGDYGSFWSRSLYSENVDYAWDLFFDSVEGEVYIDNRCNGRSVRPVRSQNQ